MPCSAEEYQGGREDDRRWQNWLGNVDYVIPAFFQPSDRADLVWVLAQAEAEGKKVKAVGRGWSYEDCAVSDDWVVDLSRLDATIPFLAAEPSGAQVLSRAWRERQFGDSAEKLYHVEAGIRIFDLNERLAGDGLAMLTLGGSQGQRLAGAISTSTHGSNLDQPPLPGVVLAIHLVTTGGREVWIESSSDPLTADDAALIDHIGCADVEIIRDDALLRAASVAVGRFGVIYAYVLRVTQAYRLSEWTEEVSWSSVAGALTAGVGRGGDVPVRAHLGDLAGLLTDPPGALEISSAPGEFHFLDILINTNLRQRSDDGCWIRRRWLTESVDDLGLDAGDNPLCDNRVARSLLLATGAALATYAGNIALIPIYGTAKAVAIGLDVTKLNALAHDPDLTGGEALAAALEAVWRAQIGHELEEHVADLNHSVLAGSIGAGGDGKRGPSWNVLAGVTEGTSGECFRANSVEIVFSTETSAYLDYVNQLLTDAEEFRIGGYISLRFSKQSDAYLSMHSVSTPLAVSVEVTSLHGLEDSARWVLHAERLGKQMGGRPHWGQQNELSSLEVAQLYDFESLHAWKDQCLRMVGPGSATFSNAYTRQRGLEPTRVVRYVTHTMKRNGTVTHLCNPGQWWSPMPVADAIEHTASQMCTYATKPPDGSAPVRLHLRRYLAAEANETHLDNLDQLPACGIGAIVPPPADRRRLRITAVVRSTSRWTVIRSVCNREENWHIPTLDAFHQIRAGTREFYVIDPVTGDEVAVTAHEYLSTNADADEQNNLGELPLLAA